MQTMFDDFVQYDLSEWLDVALLAFSWHEYENRAIANFLQELWTSEDLTAQTVQYEYVNHVNHQ